MTKRNYIIAHIKATIRAMAAEGMLQREIAGCVDFRDKSVAKEAQYTKNLKPQTGQDAARIQAQEESAENGKRAAAGFSLALGKDVKPGFKHQIIRRHRDEYPISAMCQFFGVSRSGYYSCLTQLGRIEKDSSLADRLKSQQLQNSTEKRMGFCPESAEKGSGRPIDIRIYSTDSFRRRSKQQMDHRHFPKKACCTFL